MKITILQGAFLPVPPVIGGATEKMWYALALDFVRKGHEVVYVSRSFPGMPDEEISDGIIHRRVKGYDWPGSILLLKWLDLCYTLRARAVVPPDSDIVVTNTFWAPVVLPSRLRKRCVVDVARVPKGQMKFYHEAARLRANSSPVAGAIQGEISSDQQHRIVTIPNPLPFQNLPEVDLYDKKSVLLYTGRLHPEKGLHLLIQAFRQLNTSWTLKIVGPWDKSAGGGGDKYLNTLKQLAGDACVEFTGPTHDIEKLNHYYAEASVFVYPSVAEKGETFGLAPLEAMAWGAVPIVSDLACFQDFVVHEKNGVVFNHRGEQGIEMLKMAMEKLIANADDRFKLSKEALKVRRSHSTSFIGTCFLEEFQAVVNELKVGNTVLI
ncbi:glycosyltransferase family 4 protein [Cesiribacter sp. SM1]|uniref:glycosyltransferase family 4 protein n=1 Tax=Cesiribacter sp. SM1 TaxID=2861196 RepID=UPI001CD1A26F|nr:glycosyltransferase family 4 protein [Cesiribacter sp. SM1]